MGVAHTKELDRQNNNTMLMDALAKEMYNGGVAFEVLDIRQQAPNGWKKVTGHIVWDVKMALTRKARWVLHGHKMPDPVGSTFIRVVSSKAYGSLSPMLCSMDWISLQQTLDRSQNYAFIWHLVAFHFICITFAFHLHFA